MFLTRTIINYMWRSEKILFFLISIHYTSKQCNSLHCLTYVFLINCFKQNELNVFYVTKLRSGLDFMTESQFSLPIQVIWTKNKFIFVLMFIIKSLNRCPTVILSANVFRLKTLFFPWENRNGFCRYNLKVIFHKAN